MSATESRTAGVAFGRPLRGEWLLEDGVAFLNHGSYGAAPRAVLAAQAAWREGMERQPARFMNEVLPPALRAAADDLAAFLGARGADLVFTDNATTAINAVAASAPLGPGDTVVTTSHAYPATRNTLAHHCRRAAAELIGVPLPVPVSNPDEILDAVAAWLGPRTRLAVFDHVSSHTATVMPIARLVGLCRDRGIPVLVDGAHAPGMLDLDIPAIGADWYAGNCHKWLCAPKGSGFLWTRPDRQATLHPAVISNHYGEGYRAEFDWTGTRDPTACLAVTEALAFHRRLGPARIRAHNDALARAAADLLSTRWRTEPTAPPSMRAAMATVRLPVAEASWPAAKALHDRLWRDHRIEVPILLIGGALWARISAQVYNTFEEYERLAAAIG